MGVYSGERLREISFPLGGIGTGCIGLAGSGRLIDWEIFNRRAAMSHLDATGGRVGRLDNLVQATPNRSKKGPHTMQNNPLPRLDSSPDLRKVLLPYCRLQLGDMWTNPVRGHRVGCLDAANPMHVSFSHF